METSFQIYRLDLEGSDRAELITFEDAVVEVSKYYVPSYAYDRLLKGYLIYTDKYCYWSPSCSIAVPNHINN
jgi:hypothetical protein